MAIVRGCADPGRVGRHVSRLAFAAGLLLGGTAAAGQSVGTTGGSGGGVSAGGASTNALSRGVGSALPESGPSGRRGGDARRIRITPQLRFEHESNVLRIPQGVAYNGPRDDLRVSPQVGLDVLLPFSRSRLFLNGSVGYDFYRRNKRLNRERISLDGGGSYSALGCETTLAVGIIRQQSDLADLRFFNPAVADLRNTEQRLAPRISVDCGTSVGISSSLSYEHERVTNSEPSQFFGDYSADIYGARIGVARPRLGTLSLYANHRRGEYTNRANFGGFNEKVKSTSVGGRVDRQLGLIRGFLSAGITRVESNAPGVRSFSGPSYAGGLDYAPGSRTNVHVGLGRSVEQSNLLGVSYSITDRVDARVDYALTSFVNARLLFDRSRNRYDRSPLLGLGSGRFNDTLTDYGAGISLIARRRLAIDFDATFRQRRGDQQIFNYNTRILALSLRLQ